MMILKELWRDQSDEGETKTTYQNVIDLQDRLEKTCRLATEELRKSKEKYRVQYKKKARSRLFKKGDEILLLLPTDHSKLLMQWKGPFKVEKKTISMNYHIDMGKRKQTFHANKLKKYFRRVEQATEEQEHGQLGAMTIMAAAFIEEDDNEVDEMDPLKGGELLHLAPVEPKETVRDVSIGQNLDDFARDVNRTLGNFKDRLTNIPGRCKLGEHVVRVEDKVPVRDKPYPIPHALRKEVQKWTTC